MTPDSKLHSEQDREDKRAASRRYNEYGETPRSAVDEGIGLNATWNDKIRILFLCTGNSCRSQMAEGWCRHLQSNLFDCASAGIEKHGLNPLAVRVMAEAGVDISAHYSKTTIELGDQEFDFVITVCGHADENCPFFPARTRVIHHGFDDPPKLAEGATNEDEALIHYRRVRDEIRDFIQLLPEQLS